MIPACRKIAASACHKMRLYTVVTTYRNLKKNDTRSTFLSLVLTYVTKLFYLVFLTFKNKSDLI